MTIPPEIQKKMEDGAFKRRESMNNVSEHWRSGKIAEQNFIIGFEACHALMESREKVLVECLSVTNQYLLKAAQESEDRGMQRVFVEHIKEFNKALDAFEKAKGVK